ncbi:MAG TPA: hydrogenase maturation protease [Firmicutes bacterium]|nr:hydrogenase maturation protease [Bacillota bacterium]
MSEEVKRPRILVLGLGNTVVTDDGVGIYVVRRLREIMPAHPQVTIEEAALGGFRLLDLVVGFDVLLVIDCMKSEQCPPGEIAQLDEDSLQWTVRLASQHDMNFATAMEFGRALELHMPQNVELYVIGVEDIQTLGEKCTARVEAAIEPAAQLLKKRVEAYLG